jgi:hypothetical protein
VLREAMGAERGRLAYLQCDLRSPAVAYMWDHQVAGTAIFPGAGMFEVAAAAGKLLRGALANESAALTGAVMPEPLVLPSRQALAAQPQQVLCKVETSTGSVELLSTPRSVHLRCWFSATPPASALALAPAAMASQLGGSSGSAILSGLAAAQLAAARSASMAYTGDVCSPSDIAQGVRLSPAVLDCCLHLAAVQPAGAVGQLKVPAGVGALLIPAASDDRLYSALASQKAQGSAASVIDYRLAAPGSGPACLISGLEARALRTQQRAPGASARMLYALGWAAAEALPAASAGQGQKPSLLVGATLGGGSNPASVCAAGLEVLCQFAGRQRGQLTAKLSTANALGQPFGGLGNLPSSSQRPASGSLLWGLLRAAALENATLQASAVDSDPLDVAGGVGTAALQVLEGQAGSAADGAYGLAARARVALRATLLPVAAVGGGPRSALGASSIQPTVGRQSRIVITGGMGTLGSLVAAWVAGSGLNNNVVLLGRTGRATSAQPALVELQSSASAVATTMLMADAACLEDCTAAFSTSGSAVAAVFHSGGVLADATMANQRPGMLRAVFAPKVSAAKSWQAALQPQPAEQQVLFSSVASLLGSAGQANYSAANALLDVMAGQLQQQVRCPDHQPCSPPLLCWHAHRRVCA